MKQFTIEEPNVCAVLSTSSTRDVLDKGGKYAFAKGVGVVTWAPDEFHCDYYDTLDKAIQRLREVDPEVDPNLVYGIPEMEGLSDQFIQGTVGEPLVLDTGITCEEADTMTYKWYRTESDTVIATSDKYSVAAFTAEDAGGYKCEVKASTNKGATAEREYQCNVYKESQFMTTEERKEFWEAIENGDNALLSVMSGLVV